MRLQNPHFKIDIQRDVNKKIAEAVIEYLRRKPTKEDFHADLRPLEKVLREYSKAHLIKVDPMEITNPVLFDKSAYVIKDIPLIYY